MSESNQAFRIRSGLATDEEAVVELWTRVLAYPEPHNEPVGRFRRKIVLDDGLFFVAEGRDAGAAADRIVGTAVGGYDGVRGWIYALVVDPPFRGAGVASALMTSVENELISRGCPKINLYVRPDNLGMAEFYSKFGYTAEAGVAMSKVVTRDGLARHADG